MYFTTVALVSGLAAIASAVTTPASGPPSGNSIIHPGLNELIPAGTLYDITWTPTTQGNISLILLRGPSTNVVPLMTIVDNVANTGSYSWNVPSTLQPDTTHYGVQLIVEGTGQYQYSPQCGVSSSANSSSVITNASTTVTVVPATWSSSYPTNSTWTSATSTANYSGPVLTPTGSMTVLSSIMSASMSVALSNSVVPSATATFQATPTASTAVSTGAAVANAAKNIGAMVMAGIVGALAL